MASFSVNFPKGTKYNPDLLLDAAFQTYLNYSKKELRGIKYMFSAEKHVDKPIKITYKRLINHKTMMTIDLFNMIYVLNYYIKFLNRLVAQSHNKEKIHTVKRVRRYALVTLFATCDFIYNMKNQRLIRNASKLIKTGFLSKEIRKNLIAQLHGHDVLERK